MQRSHWTMSQILVSVHFLRLLPTDPPQEPRGCGGARMSAHACASPSADLWKNAAALHETVLVSNGKCSNVGCTNAHFYNWSALVHIVQMPVFQQPIVQMSCFTILLFTLLHIITWLAVHCFSCVHCTQCIVQIQCTRESRRLRSPPPFLVNTVNRYFVTYVAMKCATFYWNNFIWLPLI